MGDYLLTKGWGSEPGPVPIEDLRRLKEAMRPHFEPLRLPAPPPELLKPSEDGYCFRDALAEGLGWRPGHPEYDALVPNIPVGEAAAVLDRLGIPYVYGGPVEVFLGRPYVFIYLEVETEERTEAHCVFTREGPRLMNYLELAGRKLLAVASLPLDGSEPKLFRVRAGDLAGRVGEMVGRFCDPSYDDVELEFDRGVRRWFRMRDVEAV